MCLAIAGAVMCGGVAIHEWNYRQENPQAQLADVLIVLSLGAALGCAAVAVVAWLVGRSDS